MHYKNADKVIHMLRFHFAEHLLGQPLKTLTTDHITNTLTLEGDVQKGYLYLEFLKARKTAIFPNSVYEQIAYNLKMMQDNSILFKELSYITVKFISMN